MKRAVLYMRNSRVEIEDWSNSLEDQKQQLHEYCINNGITIMGEYSDFEIPKGETRNYEGLNLALRLFFYSAFAKKPIDCLVINSPKIFEEIELILVRNELEFYSSELIIINEK